SKLGRMSPLLGEAFLTSAITAGRLWSIWRFSAALNPRGGSCAFARSSRSASEASFLRSATSSCLRSRILVRMLVGSIGSIPLATTCSLLLCTQLPAASSDLLFQEILQQLVPMLREDGLGVELYAFDGQRPVAHAHDLFDAAVRIFGPGRHFEAVGQRC